MKTIKKTIKFTFSVACFALFMAFLSSSAQAQTKDPVKKAACGILKGAKNSYNVTLPSTPRGAGRVTRYYYRAKRNVMRAKNGAASIANYGIRKAQKSIGCKKD